MGYFSNGEEGEWYENRYCRRCVHDAVEPCCPVLMLHAAWNYDAVGKDADVEKRFILGAFIPREGIVNHQCVMFHERGAAGA